MHCRPSRSPTARGATWARISTPAAVASESSASWRRHASPRVCTSENDSGRPDSSAMRRKIANSASTSAKSETTCSTPCPVVPIARAMPTSSSALAVSVGVSSPRLVRWFSVRDVVNPSAPCSIASRASAAISAMSASVAGSRCAPRSPITCSRNAPCGTCTATSTSNARRRERVHELAEGLPVPRAAPRAGRCRGCPRRPPSARSAGRGRPGRTGAKPTPQLPLTTVVTPCQADGTIRSPHDACPS